MKITHSSHVWLLLWPLLGCEALRPRRLRSARAIYTNDNLEVKSPEPNLIDIGAPANMYCRVPSDNSITKCQVQSALGELLTVDETGVFDENAQLVPGYLPNLGSEPQAQCGLSISSVQETDLGDWICRMERIGGATDKISGVINLRRGGRVPNIRLPTNTIPARYVLDIVGDLEPDFRTEGNFSIETLVILDGVNDGRFSMHFHSMSFVESYLRLWDPAQQSNLIINEITYDFEREMVTLSYDPPPVDASFAMVVSGRYFGVINDVGIGFYRDVYKDRETGELRYLAMTDSEPDAARWIFPCLDEPNLKATFKIRVGRHDTLKSLSNARLIDSYGPVENFNRFVWDEYEETELMPTYLVAISINEFEMVASDPLPNQVDFRTWARPNAIQDGLAEYSKLVGSRTLQFYDDFFLIPYPYPKMDQIATPSYGGGMENWGLIHYGEYLFLLEEDHTSDLLKSIAVLLNTHELGHQWFGNLVTTAWWTHLWLNEGFAEYVQYVAHEFIAPEMTPWDLFVLQEMHPTFKKDALVNTRPILDVIEHPADTNWGDITYGKGSCMNRMMTHFLTRATFDNAMRAYLMDYQYSNTVTDDLWDVIDRVAHQEGTLNPLYSIKEIMDPWLQQKNFPLLTATRDYASATVQLTQSRFLMSEDNTGDPHNYQWWIPISYTPVGDGLSDFVSTNFTNNFLEPNAQKSINVPDVPNNPIVFNIQNLGYYRVNYDQTNWDLLAEFLLNNDHTEIHVVNRAQLISDSFTLAMAGTIDFSVPLQLVQYLTKETDYVPMAAAQTVFSDLLDLSGLDSDAADLLAFLTSLMGSKYDQVGMAENNANSWLENEFQRTVVSSACGLAQYPNCIQDATASFAQFMQVPDPDDLSQNPVNRQVRGEVYCTAISNGGQSEYDFLLERYENCFNEQEKSVISYGLSCQTKTKSKDQLLRSLLKPESKEAFEVLFQDMASNRKTSLRFLFQWLRTYFDSLKELKFGVLETAMASLAQQLGQRGHDEDDLKLAHELRHLAKQGEMESVLPFLDEAMDAIQGNQAWRTKHLHRLQEVLREMTNVFK